MVVYSARRALGSIRNYDRRWLRNDVIAGLTVWAVLVPEALAYASIAGVSPVVGLYAAPPALVLYALFGSSRHLIVGPMSATAAMSAAAIADLTTGGPEQMLAFTGVLALVTGLLALGAGLLKLGFLANFISEPVLKGFIIGLALTIMVGQLPKILGVEKQGENFFAELWHLLASIGDTHGWSLLVGAVSLGAVVGLERWLPAIPGSLMAVIIGVVGVMLFDLDAKGVAVVGDIDAGLPTFGLPAGVVFGDYLRAAAFAGGMMLVGFAEGLGAAKTYAARDHYEIDPNRELVGLGVANLGSGLVSGMVVNGSLSKTAINGAAGARTQLSGIIAAGGTIVALLFLTGWFERLPEPTLAAVVIAAVVGLVDIDSLRGYYQLYNNNLGRIYGHAARPDFIAAVAALIGVLTFDVLPGLALGIVVSLLLLLYRTSKPHVAELGRVPGTADQYGDVVRHHDNQPEPGVVVLRVEAGLFFANTDAVRAVIKLAVAAPDVYAVVLDGASIPFVDLSAVRMLTELGAEFARDGHVLAVAHEIGQVDDVLALAGNDSVLMFPTVAAAIAAIGHPA